MSLNHIVNPLTDADFKTLKVNGTEIVSSPALVTYTPTLTGTSLINFLINYRTTVVCSSGACNL